METKDLSLNQLQLITVVGSSAVMGIGAMMVSSPTANMLSITPDFLATVVAGGALICVGAMLFVGGVIYFEVQKI